MSDIAVTSKDDLMRGCIVEAAHKLFRQFGVGKTTMEDIARNIGKGKSSLYYYFATKEDIFATVVEKEKDAVCREIQDAIDREYGAEARLRAMAHAKHKALRKRMLLYKITLVDLPRDLCVFEAVGKRYKETELNLIRNILEEGIAAGVFDIKEHDRNIVATVIANSLHGLALQITFGAYTGSAAVLIDTTIDLLMAGLYGNGKAEGSHARSFPR